MTRKEFIELINEEACCFTNENPDLFDGKSRCSTILGLYISCLTEVKNRIEQHEHAASHDPGKAERQKENDAAAKTARKSLGGE